VRSLGAGRRGDGDAGSRGGDRAGHRARRAGGAEPPERLHPPSAAPTRRAIQARLVQHRRRASPPRPYFEAIRAVTGNEWRVTSKDREMPETALTASAPQPRHSSLVTRHSHRGVFITLEGPEGGGKSTLAPLLAGHLRSRGLNVITC